ncbi:DMT family transporter [Paenibacillus antri]|uniref:DMT family transporter n=1 Tax=Paenibacillus antri TaxID=2582848 RepID=A0A5R9G451_9BACL|nr:DMT family transporter [Paenibacillus antri]TLS49799.1 DMT family transporter [Paenibacillus antri]
MNTKKFFTNPYGVAVSAVVCTALWGSAFPVIKRSYEALDIRSDETAELLWFAGLRFLLAAILILIFASLMRSKVGLRRSALPSLLKIGVFQTFLQYVLFYIGLSLSTGMQGAVISGTTSFFQMLFAHFLYADDKLNVRKAAGLLVGFAGVVAVNLTQGAFELRFGAGELCLLLAMAAAGLGNLFARDGSASMPVAYLTGYQMLFGAIGLLAAGATTAGGWPRFDFTLASAGMLAYLAFLSAAGFVLWNTIMKYNRVGNVSMYLFLIPVFGVLLSALLLGEALHRYILLGLVLVAAGIVVVNRKKEAPNTEEAVG